MEGEVYDKKKDKHYDRCRLCCCNRVTGCSQQKNNTETVEQSETESMTKEEKDIVLKVKGIKNYTVSASSIKDKDADTARKDIPENGHGQCFQ